MWKLSTILYIHWIEVVPSIHTYIHKAREKCTIIIAYFQRASD
uniref:Uncharacterized protein n=1 Tax=Arundo donax TaxID=35708 RepID=A0A0A9C0J0_ARUDO